jgi:hypothetical protein
MTQHEYEKYRNDLTGEGQRDARYLKAAILCLVLGLALLYPIFCSAQDLPPGAPSAGMVLRRSAGSSGTGTQPPFAPTTRPASSHHLLPLALTYAGLQLVDGWQTTTALNSGRYREANGALIGIAGSPWKLGLVKGAVTSGSLLGIYAMRKQHPRASKWLLVGLAGAQAVVVGWNAKEMR